MRGRTWKRLLDAGTALVLVAALALLVEARVLPAWRARAVVELGERVPMDLGFAALATGDRIQLDRGLPTLMLVFRSDCPACAAVAPRWRTLTGGMSPGVRVLAVGLESAATALPYARRQLPDALAVAPRDRERFLRVLDVSAVPATLLVDAGGRLRFRRQGTATDADVAAVRTLVDRPDSRLPNQDRRTP